MQAFAQVVASTVTSTSARAWREADRLALTAALAAALAGVPAGGLALRAAGERALMLLAGSALGLYVATQVVPRLARAWKAPRSSESTPAGGGVHASAAAYVAVPADGASADVADDDANDIEACAPLAKREVELVSARNGDALSANGAAEESPAAGPSDEGDAAEEERAPGSVGGGGEVNGERPQQPPLEGSGSVSARAWDAWCAFFDGGGRANVSAASLGERVTRGQLAALSLVAGCAGGMLGAMAAFPAPPLMAMYRWLDTPKKVCVCLCAGVLCMAKRSRARACSGRTSALTGAPTHPPQHTHTHTTTLPPRIRATIAQVARATNACMTGGIALVRSATYASLGLVHALDGREVALGVGGALAGALGGHAISGHVSQALFQDLLLALVAACAVINVLGGLGLGAGGG